MIFTTVAAFFGIFLLAYTRKTGWIAVILGVILEFVAVMFETFRFFGIISPAALLFDQYPVTEVLLKGLPSICFSIGFILVLAERRKR